MIGLVKRFLEEHDSPQRGGIVAGVSGGADSVCLLLILSELASEMGFSLRAVHVNHGIRGEEADRDEAFVRKLCKKKGIPCHVFVEDVPAEAARLGIGYEEAGRMIRYRRFLEVAEQTGAKAVAVAHHLDDNAETVLFRLIRGTGIRGLAGIPEVIYPFENSGIALIRPLLGFTREDILEELSARGEKFRKDRSNDDNSYARNLIRNRIMPQLEAVNSGASLHLASFAGHAKEITEFLDAEADRVYREAYRDGVVQREDLKNVPSVVRKEVLLRYVKERTGVSKDFTERHVQAMEKLLLGPVSKELNLPGITLVSTYFGIREKSSRKRTEEEPGEIALTPGTYRLFDGRTLTVSVRAHVPGEPVEKKKWIKWLDYDMINCVPVLRTRREGDFFVPGAEGGTKLLREFYVGMKIHKEQRDRMQIVAAGSEVLWIPGFRGTERYFVTERTERILVLSVT